MILISEHERVATENEEHFELVPPSGWVTSRDPLISKPHSFESDTENYHSSIIHNLPRAAGKVELLIDALHLQWGIQVPVSYLRVDEATSFHILLLISRDNFVSPKMHAARLLAERFVNSENDFDLHFQFTVLSENCRVDSILGRGYTLMRIRDDLQETA